VVEQLLRIDRDWAAPLLWRSEFLNVLAVYIRLRGWELDDAINAYHEASSLIVHEELAVPEEVLALISGSPCTAYDLQYVALAQKLRVPLVTFDKQLLAEFPGMAVTPEEFVGWN
jgi:predicted nucleic acid-binding protein